MSFETLGLEARLLKALEKQGYQTPTPIQEQAIPIVLEGRDLLGCAQTGTGKTAAFSLPILHQLLDAPPRSPYVQKGPIRPIRTLILTPTRELAGQIGENIAAYGQFTPLRHAVIFGGVKQFGQVQQLKKGVDILVATPGRLLDLIYQGIVSLHAIEIFVLDEADRMLDMGFINDIRKVISRLPDERQTLFFSATMPQEIQGLADSILNKPVRIEVSPVSSTVEIIEQQIYFVDQPQKQALLKHLLEQKETQRVLIFTRTRHGADRVVKHLGRVNIQADAIHSDKSQNARQNALERFKNGQSKVLVATDIAARGIDVDDITHVINFDLPNVGETYVHRIGRTGRAGATGIAISFCDASERPHLKEIEKTIRKRLTPVRGHAFESTATAAEEAPKALPPALRKGSGNSLQSRRRRQQRKPGS
jgi:ATP-dependent RNA helicase RhlE